MKKYLPHIALSLFLAEIMLILLSWLLSAAMPNSGIRSLLSGEGLRWFMGHFGNILATPQLAWLLLAAIAVGCLKCCGFRASCPADRRQHIGSLHIGHTAADFHAPCRPAQCHWRFVAFAILL